MSEQLPKPGGRAPSPHDVPPKTIAIIVGVMVLGLALGMLLVMPHYGPRKPRHRSALGHASATSMIGRETNGMVWIPGSTFVMGSTDGREDEIPAHEVTVSPIWMDKTEVTNAEFRKFIEATGYKTVAEQGGGPNWREPAGPGSTIEGKDREPVVYVSWEDAEAYAKWAGKRLPSEAEWEHAARGGLNQQTYVWGNEKPNPDQPFANLKVLEDHFPGVAPVGSFPPNGYRLYDMAGNVWEWCSDRYANDYYRTSPKLNPKGPEGNGATKRVLRGGSYLSDTAGELYRPATRRGEPPRFAAPDVGFRCVRDAY